MVFKHTKSYKLPLSKPEIVKLYRSGKSMYKIAKICSCTPQTILYHLQQCKVKGRSFSIANRKYSHTRSFFKTINTEEKAYFLGLLYADGNVHNNVISIALQAPDVEIVKMLKKALHYNGPLYIIQPHHRTKHIQTKLNITSPDLAKDLAFHGMTPNKGFILKYPSTVPIKLSHHFIRGYFDGDGCIYANHINHDYLFTITSTLELLQQAQKIIIDATNLNTTKLYNPPCMKGKNLYTLTYQGGISV